MNRLEKDKKRCWVDGWRMFSCTLAALTLIVAVTWPAAWPCGSVRADVVPTEPILVLPAELDPNEWGSARCNDGTPFGFMIELSPEGSDNWVIYLEGGGFCEDYANLCSDRNPRYTSTPGDQAVEDYYRSREKALLSPDADFNPSFHNANKVWAFYCSSDVWSGDTAERRPSTGDPEGWYFSGRHNVQAMISVLIQQFGLDDLNDETRVLYAGGSAGGQGVQATADLLWKLMPRTAMAGRLKLVNDAGSVFEFDHLDYRFAGTDLTFRQVMISAYDFWGSRLNPKCEQAMARDMAPPGTCFDELIVYPYIVEPRPSGLGLPLFVQQSSIDGFQLRKHGIWDPEGTQIFRTNTLARFEEVSWTWLFSGGNLVYHCVTIRNDRWVMGPEGYQFRDVLTRFWEGYPPEVVIYGNP